MRRSRSNSRLKHVPFFPARPPTYAVLALASLAAVAALYALVPEVGAWLRQAGNLLRAAEVQGIRMLLYRAGPLEPLVAAALGAYVALAPWLPLAPLAEAATGRLGTTAGVTAVALGLVAGGTAGFLLAAALLRPLCRLIPGIPRDRSPAAIPWLALAARLVPAIGQGWVSYVTGALPMRLRDHVWSATLGALFAVMFALVR